MFILSVFKRTITKSETSEIANETDYAKHISKGHDHLLATN